MTEAKTLVRGERFEAIRTGEFGDQTIGVYSKLSPLDSGRKIEVQLPAESLLNKLIISGDQPQRRILLREEIAFAILLISAFPLLPFFLGGKIFFRRIVRFCMGRKPWFWGGKGRGI
jgi:hypothetical protein